MTSVSRRAFLASAVAAAAVARLPAGASTPVASVAAPLAKLEPMWIVGTPGECDAGTVRAATADLARRFWAEEREGEHEADNDEPKDECACGFCIAYGGAEATRVPAWDNRDENSITSADWLRQDYGMACSRCGEEASADYLHALGSDVICDDCMTLADWDVVDPQIAAELRADLAQDEVPA